MYLSIRMVMALLLLVLGASPMQGIPHQTTTTPAINEQEASSPNPDASGIYHGGKGVTPPLLIYSVDPEFTDKARKKKLSGTCIVSMVVDVTGTPQNVQVVESIASSNPKLQSAAKGLDENAIKAARQYRFKPGTYQGKPVPVEIKVEIDYRIY